jgi:CRP-like cAMP-binding protein
MEDFLTLLQSCRLFSGLPEAFIRTEILPHGKLRTYNKDAEIITPQECVDRFGIILKGKIRILQAFSDGSYSLMETLMPLFMVGSDLICTRDRRSPYYAVAAEETQVLFFPAALILEQGLLPETERMVIWRQLLAIISNDNIRKHYRLAILSQRGLRERILIYLTMQAGRLGTNTFRIPFSRDELADFLCVNRSALSHELSLMEQEGLIRFRKNEFTLLSAGDRQSIWKHFD